MWYMQPVNCKHPQRPAAWVASQSPCTYPSSGRRLWDTASFTLQSSLLLTRLWVLLPGPYFASEELLRCPRGKWQRGIVCCVVTGPSRFCLLQRLVPLIWILPAVPKLDPELEPLKCNSSPGVWGMILMVWQVSWSSSTKTHVFQPISMFQKAV